MQAQHGHPLDYSPSDAGRGLGRLATPRARRVWLVDNSPLQLDVTGNVFAGSYALETFATGEALRERLAKGPPPDLLVLDWELPRISAIDVCRFVRSQHAALTLPILMLTSRTDEADVELAFQAGGIDHVSKPPRAAALQLRERADQHRQDLATGKSLALTTRILGSGTASTPAIRW